MSAVIEELKLQNFEGYKRQELTFTPGLNLITGRNSSGKSALLDAILFALYGDVPEVEKRLLVSRLQGVGKMKAYVKLKSPRLGSRVEVLRAGGLTKGGFKAEERSLFVDGKEVQVQDDEDLRKRMTELMGLSLKRFAYLAYVRQGELAGALRPEKDEMDSVLGISVLRELRDQLDLARKELEKYDGRDAKTEVESLEKVSMPSVEERIRGLESDIGALRKEVQSLEDLVGKAESPELVALLGLIKQRDEAWKGANEAKIEAMALIKGQGASSLEELLDKMRLAKLKLVEDKNKEDEKSEEADGLQKRFGELSGKAKALEDEVSEHRGLLQQGISKCPTCGQDITSDNLEMIISSKTLEVEGLRREAESIKKLHEAAKEAAAQLGQEAAKLRERIGSMERAMKSASDKLQDAKNLEVPTAQKVAEIKVCLEKLSLPFQPEDIDLKAKVAQRLPISPEELEKKKGELDEKRSDLEEKEKLKASKEREFHEASAKLEKLKMRLRRAKLAEELTERLEEAVESRRKEMLRRIEVRALSIYNSLTEQHNYSSISIEPESYRVYVHPKGLSEVIPAMRVGGGHQTLIALAVRLAMLDALKFRSLLILDEPTYGVDSENLPQLMGHIVEASKLVSQVILVTHHGLGEEEASNIIKVNIGEDGSSRAEVAS